MGMKEIRVRGYAGMKRENMSMGEGRGRVGNADWRIGCWVVLP